MMKLLAFLRPAWLLVLGALLVGAIPARAQKVPHAAFPTPEAAFEAFVAASRTGDPERLVPLLGPGSRVLVHSGDPVADREVLASLVRASEERVFFQREGEGRVTACLGFDNWPLPIPLVKTCPSWRFDSRAGAEEVLRRRIGRNELSTLETLRAIVVAQRDYYARDLDQDGVVEYAARLVSSPDRKDGLYWPVAAGQEASPLGPEIARAWQEGYRTRGAPYHGYYYRLLTAQGPEARGGAYDYLRNGHMVGGFAVLAWPAAYGSSGVTTFLVNTNGILWEKDLGPRTDALARAMKAYNPDRTWTRAK